MKNIMPMSLHMNSYASVARHLYCNLIADGRLSTYVRFPSIVDSHCFKLEFLTPIETFNDNDFFCIVTGISVNVVPNANVQINRENLNVIETTLVNGSSSVYSNRLRHCDVRSYNTIDELIQMIIWIAEGNSDNVRTYNYEFQNDQTDNESQSDNESQNGQTDNEFQTDQSDNEFDDNWE